MTDKTPITKDWLKEQWQFAALLIAIVAGGTGLWFGIKSEVKDAQDGTAAVQKALPESIERIEKGIAEFTHAVNQKFDKIEDAQVQQTKDTTALREQAIRDSGETKNTFTELRGSLERVKDAVDRLERTGNSGSSDTGMGGR